MGVFSNFSSVLFSLKLRIKDIQYYYCYFCYYCYYYSICPVVHDKIVCIELQRLLKNMSDICFCTKTRSNALEEYIKDLEVQRKLLPKLHFSMLILVRKTTVYVRIRMKFHQNSAIRFRESSLSD